MKNTVFIIILLIFLVSCSPEIIDQENDTTQNLSLEESYFLFTDELISNKHKLQTYLINYLQSNFLNYTEDIPNHVFNEDGTWNLDVRLNESLPDENCRKNIEEFGSVIKENNNWVYLKIYPDNILDLITKYCVDYVAVSMPNNNLTREEIRVYSPRLSSGIENKNNFPDWAVTENNKIKFFIDCSPSEGYMFSNFQRCEPELDRQGINYTLVDNYTYYLPIEIIDLRRLPNDIYYAKFDYGLLNVTPSETIVEEKLKEDLVYFKNNEPTKITKGLVNDDGSWNLELEYDPKIAFCEQHLKEYEIASYRIDDNKLRYLTNPYYIDYISNIMCIQSISESEYKNVFKPTSQPTFDGSLQAKTYDDFLNYLKIYFGVRSGVVPDYIINEDNTWNSAIYIHQNEYTKCKNQIQNFGAITGENGINTIKFAAKPEKIFQLYGLECIQYISKGRDPSGRDIITE